MVLGPMESIHSMGGPSTLPSISGSVPGLLDPSQSSRLLRFSNSKLSFAAFDPLTASAAQDAPDIRKMSINEAYYRPRRIVVETAPNGESFWRFVPKARIDEGVLDEGVWPRIVEICGVLVECSQDQWDIYKLDSQYDCLVRPYPKLSIIHEVAPKPAPKPVQDPNASSQTSSKRGVPASPPERDTSPVKKRPHIGVSIVESSEEEDEEDEVEYMIVDEIPRPRTPGERLKKKRAEIERQRQWRKEQIALAEAKKMFRSARGMAGDVPQAGPSTPMPQSQPQSLSPESPTKRKDSSYFRPRNAEEPSQGVDGERWQTPSPSKRTRKVSPIAIRRDLEGKRTEREKRKQEKWEKRLDERRRERDRRLMEDVFTEIPEFGGYTNGTTEDSEDEYEADYEAKLQRHEEAARAAAIAESRRKLAELEADRPIWEEQAKIRAAREKAEEEARRAKAEAKKEAERQEAERKLKEEREEREARQREEALRKEAQARRERDRRQHHRWTRGIWNTERALERYKSLCVSFDETKFLPDDPLTFEDVPWPVLHPPASFTIEDIDWGAVEKFFEAVKPRMRTPEYKAFVQSSQRRFHPDRWRARGLLNSIVNETERGCLEVAANSVAQALTPLWREVKGYVD